MPSVERVRHPVCARLLEVRDVESPAADMLRITLTGETLADFRSAAPDDHVKLLFAPPGERRPALPSFEPGTPRYPPGAVAPVTRDYTPRRFDRARRELVVDFVVHGDGPASTWAARATPGQLVGQAGPRGSLVVSEDFDWYLLAGDETALPAIARRLEELPAHAHARVIAETSGPAGELELPTRAALELTWLHRAGAGPGTTDALERAVRAWDPPAGAGFAWAAAEAGTARALRAHLREERGLRREWTRVTGYWKRGTADHHDPPEPA